MIYDYEHGTYLFLYQSYEDCGATADEWYENIEQAKNSAYESFHINHDDWEEIPDPLEFCQHDWISPVRIPGRNISQPQWGKLEKLIDGN
jgi:biofilm protein TabA